MTSRSFNRAKKVVKNINQKLRFFMIPIKILFWAINFIYFPFSKIGNYYAAAIFIYWFTLWSFLQYKIVQKVFISVWLVLEFPIIVIFPCFCLCYAEMWRTYHWGHDPNEHSVIIELEYDILLSLFIATYPHPTYLESTMQDSSSGD
jgi:hypothetical protein